MRYKDLPIPKVLIDLAEDCNAPCLKCNELLQFIRPGKRQWSIGSCKKGWLPSQVTVAALENLGSKWGQTIRKLASLCPYRIEPYGLHGRLVTMYLVVQSSDADTIRARIELMLKTLPLKATALLDDKKWT